MTNSNIKSLIGYLLKKCGRLVTLLFCLCVLSFILVSLSPVDPVNAYVGADMMKVSSAQRAQIAHYWGLDQPPTTRLVKWIAALARGDWGMSAIFRQPVIEIIRSRFWASLVLMFFAWILSGIFGFILGILAGVKHNTLIDRLIKWYCLTLASAPTFWLGLLLLMVFAVWLGWFPVGFQAPIGVLHQNISFGDFLKHLILPVITLSVVGVAAIALHTRQKLIDILKSDYVLFARARGEKGWSLITSHALRNIALPALTLQFASFSELFGGAVLAEQVFSYPGLGNTTVEAGLRGDVPLLLGCVIFSALFVFTGNLAADLLYHWIDPRVNSGAQS